MRLSDHVIAAIERKKENLRALEIKMEQVASLPPDAMTKPITHYDYLSLLLLIRDLHED
jgi:hypothetical protein